LRAWKPQRHDGSELSTITVDHTFYTNLLYTRDLWQRYDWKSGVVKPTDARMSSVKFESKLKTSGPFYSK
jgi:ABC-type uncharacterized transport system substrate-binding protein